LLPLSEGPSAALLSETTESAELALELELLVSLVVNTALVDAAVLTTTETALVLLLVLVSLLAEPDPLVAPPVLLAPTDASDAPPPVPVEPPSLSRTMPPASDPVIASYTSWAVSIMPATLVCSPSESFSGGLM
jgi:hypothetical protein